MSKPKNLFPELRFPEFKNNGQWVFENFGNICQFVRGPFGGALKKDFFVKSGFAVYEQYHAIHGDFNSFRYFVNEEKFNELKRFEVKPNDLIMSCSGTMGKFAIIPLGSRKGIINQALLKLTVNKNHDLHFIKYTLEYPANQDKLLSQSAGGAIKNVVGVAELKKIKLLSPRLIEQQKITDCLSSIDNLITAHTQKLDALKAHKKGLMQQLFPKKGETVPKLRFPEFKGTESWEIKPLSKLFDIGSGKDHKHLSKGDIPVYGSGGYMRSVDKYLYDGESACIGRKGTIDKPIFLSGKFWTVDTLFYTYNFRDSLPKFVYALFQNINWLEHNEAGGVPSLSKVIINRIKVATPVALKEQKKIVDFLETADNSIEFETKKIQTLQNHKQGLMQRLFPSISEMTK